MDQERSGIAVVPTERQGMKGRLSWRTGFDVKPRVAGFAPLIALVVGAVGIVLNIRNTNGDIRVGAFPWAMSISVVCLAICCLGVLSVHGPKPNWWTVAGAWWATVALLGIAAFFLSIAVGSSLRIDMDNAGLLSVLPFLGAAFGLLTLTPALLTLAVGVTRARILRWFGIAAVWVAAPVLPILMISGGLAEGTAETVSVNALAALFVGAWIVLGLSLRHISPGVTSTVGQ